MSLDALVEMAREAIRTGDGGGIGTNALSELMLVLEVIDIAGSNS